RKFAYFTLLCFKYHDSIFPGKVNGTNAMMKLIETLDQCIERGQDMTRAIAIAQFGDDSPEARQITRRWGITEAAELVGVTPQAIRDAEKSQRLPVPDMERRGRVEQRIGYTIQQINYMR